MIKKSEIEKLARLGRITVTSEEAESFEQDFVSIVDYISEIRDLSGDNADATTPAVENVMRADEPSHERGAFTKRLVDAMPESKNGYLKVKKILADR